MPLQLPTDTKWHAQVIFAQHLGLFCRLAMRRPLRMRSSVLFWNRQILQRATIPSQYLWGFFNFPAINNFFLGALPPTVGWSFFPAGSSPSDIECPASVAIWVNCQVSDNCGDLPTSSSHSASATLLLISSLSGEVYCAGAGGSTGVGGLQGWLWASALVLACLTCSPSPFLGMTFVLAMLDI